MVTRSKQTDSRASFPATELEKYRGKWVAFSADGSRIVASRDTELEADAHAQSLGMKPADYVLEAIPAVDTLLQSRARRGWSLGYFGGLLRSSGYPSGRCANTDATIGSDAPPNVQTKSVYRDMDVRSV